MPELPEVQTTVNGIRKHVVGLTITDAWSDYDSTYFKGQDNIKDPAYFKHFKKAVVGRRIISAERRAKNVLINLSGGQTILVHMKMTGHLLYGRYEFDARAKKDPWRPIEPAGLKNPFNRRIHFMLTFNNGRQLALSDTRKFAKVTVLDTESAHDSDHLSGIGPEPLDASFTYERFAQRIDARPNGRIKQVLMDQSVMAGVGNIYADEALWRASIHPLERVKDIDDKARRALFTAIKKVLEAGIDLGGDSMSDYRNIYGEKGGFQEKHHAYKKTGTLCDRPGCGGTIRRILVGSRSAHYCDRHQRLLKSKR